MSRPRTPPPPPPDDSTSMRGMDRRLYRLGVDVEADRERAKERHEELLEVCTKTQDSVSNLAKVVTAEIKQVDKRLSDAESDGRDAKNRLRQLEAERTTRPMDTPQSGELERQMAPAIVKRVRRNGKGIAIGAGGVGGFGLIVWILQHFLP